MYRLAIVDDDAEVREGLSLYFPWAELGFEVVATLGDAEELLRRLAEGGIDAVLCDVRLPRQSGLEAARVIAREWPDVRIVFLSGHGDYQYLRAALQCQAVDYVLKPAAHAELTSVFLRLKSQLDETRGPRAEAGSSMVEQIVAAVRRYVECNYRTATLEATARVVRMNPNYLSEYFKRRAGVTFSQYLTKVRMEKAGALLRDFRYRTYEVGALVGYQDANNFTRAFRRYFHKSPREYRAAPA
jgi:two-component system response regulator YesN